MPDFHFAHDHLIMDACCVINLRASGRMEAVLTSAPIQMAIAEYVKEYEALAFFNGPKEDVTRQREDIDLQPLIDANILELADLDLKTESDAYVGFADELDDGEAVTGAIALNRGWGIATDDKKAISVFKGESPETQIITTPELMKIWVDIAKPSSRAVHDALRCIELRARYRPGVRHALHPWWTEMLTPG